MDDYFRFIVPNALIPQVTGELLALAPDPDLVTVVHGDNGQEIHVATFIAEAWYELHQARQKKQAEAAAAPQTPVEAPAPTIEPSPPMSVGPVPPPAPKAKAASKSSALTNDSEDAKR